MKYLMTSVLAASVGLVALETNAQTVPTFGAGFTNTVTGYTNFNPGQTFGAGNAWLVDNYNPASPPAPNSLGNINLVGGGSKGVVSEDNGKTAVVELDGN